MIPTSSGTVRGYQVKQVKLYSFDAAQLPFDTKAVVPFSHGNTKISGCTGG